MCASVLFLAGVNIYRYAYVRALSEAGLPAYAAFASCPLCPPYALCLCKSRGFSLEVVRFSDIAPLPAQQIHRPFRCI
jgi:hypothetical protein